MAAPGSNPWHIKIPFIFLTLFWGSWIVLGAVLRFLSAPKKFLFTKDYSKLPKIAKNRALGETGFVTVKFTEAKVSATPLLQSACPSIYCVYMYLVDS